MCSRTRWENAARSWATTHTSTSRIKQSRGPVIEDGVRPKRRNTTIHRRKKDVPKPNVSDQVFSGITRTVPVYSSKHGKNEASSSRKTRHGPCKKVARLGGTRGSSPCTTPPRLACPEFGAGGLPTCAEAPGEYPRFSVNENQEREKDMNGK